MAFVETPTPRPERRWAILNATAQLLVELCKPDAPCVYSVTRNPLPADARLVTVLYDPLTYRLRLVLESETFDPICDGCLPPELPVPELRMQPPAPEAMP